MNELFLLELKSNLQFFSFFSQFSQCLFVILKVERRLINFFSFAFCNCVNNSKSGSMEGFYIHL